MLGRRLATLALLVALALVSGCGGGGGGSRLSKSDYEAKMQAAGKNLKQAFSLNGASSLAQLADAIEKGQKQLEKSADELDAVAPPKNVETDHNTFVKALRGIAKALNPLKAAAQEGDLQKAQSEGSRFQTLPAVREASRASAAMKAKGYKIGELGISG